ncbi:FAD-dependent monooxygenase [Hyalangium versicolor]|uniref:FAD-dependent monooxygenase n=1 Tax=Hyalangium versicolor TaxID=2861190 RepID=UPI001CCA06A4|nr:FAD-dependent monooxygenase [Hyalangium versicolor]
MRILISGASVAGPVLAYWLARYGFQPTVVERSPTLRKTGGHAVDLFRPAMEIVERMGLLSKLEAKKTGTDRLTLLREGVDRPIEVDVARLVTAVSDRHVEIMRDDLAELFHDATRDSVEYVFGDSIAALAEDAGGIDVTFERGAPRRFDLVIGADGLHSNVRRLVFGDERRFAHWIGAYLAVMTLPNYLGLKDRSITLGDVGRLVVFYSGQHMDDARALFMFRTPRELDIHYRDVARQKGVLREAFAGLGWEVPRLLEELDRTPAFYFDSITQLRMDTWSRGRVTLAGDAGYSPGPAVGGSTSLAIVGAYVLAGELAAAGGDHVRGFQAYERELGDYVRRSRTFALHTAKNLVSSSRFQLWALVQAARLISLAPPRMTRALSKLSSKGVRLHDSIALKDYGHQARVAA